MQEPPPNADLVRAFSHTVRGLSTLFWALPVWLLLAARTALSDWLRPMGPIPPLLAALAVCYGLWQLSFFQPRDRSWILPLERTQLLAVVLAGLSPFVHWWNQAPRVPFFIQMTTLLMLLAIVFLISLNQFLPRFTGLIPDETIRHEAVFFCSINRVLLWILLGCLGVIYVLGKYPIPRFEWIPMALAHHQGYLWVFLTMILLPLALTMSLLWRIKETILVSVYASRV